MNKRQIKEKLGPVSFTSNGWYFSDAMLFFAVLFIPIFELLEPQILKWCYHRYLCNANSAYHSKTELFSPNRPFEIRTIQIPDPKMSGFRMIPDFECPEFGLLLYFYFYFMSMVENSD